MVRPVLKGLLGCILLCVGIVAPRAAYPADIDIAGATAAAGGARALALVVDGPDFTWPIVVRRNDGGAAPVPVRVDLTSLVGPSAQLANPLHLSLNGQDVATAEFDLASLRQQEVRLGGTLPVEGDFTGQLGVIVDGKRVPYDLKVTRRKPANPPKARFVGATSDNKLAMTSDKSTFEWPLIVRRDDTSKQQVVEVTLHVSPMSGPSGTIIAPKLLKDGKPLTEAIKLGPAQQSLTLSGTADREGSYTGEISYDVDGTSASVMLTLTRTHPDLDFKIEPISKTHATAGDPVTLQLRLLNTSSTARELYLPSIVQFERTDILGSGPVQVATGDYKVDFRRHDGQPLQPLTVKGDGTLALAATITGLTMPGAYKGSMRFTAPDRKPADAAFELSLRLPLQWPAGAIFVGVIAAAFLRYHQNTGQPRLLLQRNALTLRSNVTTLLQTESRDLNDRERHVFKTLIEQIDDASDKLADPDVPIETTSAIIATVRRKSSLLTPWITARRRQDTLPPEVAAAIEPDLTFAFDTLTDIDATDAEITTADTRLDGIEAKISTELTRNFAEAVGKLRKAIEEFDPADQPRFDPVKASLDTVTAQSNQSHFEEAAKALAQARSKFAEIAADLLRATLAAAPTAIGFTAPDWTAFVAEITGLLDGVVSEPDPEKRVQRWTEVNRRYLVRVVQRAKARIDELVEADIAGTQDALKRAQAKLLEAQAALAKGEMGAARTHYEGAIDAAGNVRQTLRAQGEQLGKPGGGDAPAPGSGADLPGSIIVAAIASVWPLPLGRNVTLAQVTKRLRRSNILFGIAMVLIAVVSGVQLLYVANPTFGYVDVIVCFLWGAGLHAIAGQTFQGLTGLTQALR